MLVDAAILRAFELLGGPHVMGIVPETEFDVHDMLCRRLPSRAAAELVANLPMLLAKEPAALDQVLGLGLDLLKPRGMPSSKKLNVARSWKVWEFARIVAEAERKFGAIENVEVWLWMPSINGRRPLDLLVTPVGASLVHGALKE